MPNKQKVTNISVDVSHTARGINWEREGDEWLQRVLKTFSKASGARGWSAAQAKGTLVLNQEYTFTDAKIMGRLRVTPNLDGSISVSIVYDTKPQEEEHNLWIESLVQATSEQGQEYSEYEWSAVIGPTPSIDTSAKSIMEKIAIGDIVINAGSMTFYEYYPSLPTSFYSRSLLRSRPSVLTGKIRAFDKLIAMKVAATKIYKICGLLSLFLDRSWTLREYPREGTSVIPLHPQWENHSPETFPADNDGYWEEIKIPDWLLTAALELEDDSQLAKAVNIYYEAMQLVYTNPSLAMVAFVASIESVGQIIKPVKACKHCGQIGSSIARFKEALSTVYKQDEVKQIMKDYGVYERRSRTAHDGVLHGTEKYFGFIMPSGFFSMIQASNPDGFLIMIYKIRTIAGKILIKMLREKFEKLEKPKLPL